MSARTDRWPAELTEQLRELWPTGKSTAAIGRVLGVSKNAIVSKSRRLGLEARPSPILVAGHPKTTPLTDEQRDSIRCLAEQGKSDDVIAAAHGIGPWTVRRLLKRQDASGLRRDRIRALGPIKATPLPPPTPRPAIQPPPPRPVIVLPLSGTSGPCCFPLGEPGTKAFRYCDDPSVRGKPYCADHVRLCYVAKPRAEPKEFTFGWSSPA